MTHEIYLPPLNKDNAVQLGSEIDTLLDQITSHELRLASSYARLGGLLREVKNQQYWMVYGYDRFSSYLSFICEKIGRQRSQVYAILTVAETLLPLVSEEQLESVGISKAHELRRLVKQGGNINSEVLDDRNQTEDTLGTVQLMDYASRPNVTAAMLRVKVNELLHCHEGPSGNWIDLGGFYTDPEERKELEVFWNIGRKILGLTNEQADHIWKKEVMMAAVREATSTWQGEIGNASA
jgi:hypothetical protein